MIMDKMFLSGLVLSSLWNMNPQPEETIQCCLGFLACPQTCFLPADMPGDHGTKTDSHPASGPDPDLHCLLSILPFAR